MLELPGWGLFNTSVCKAGDRYVMAIEIDKPPEVVGVAFMTRIVERIGTQLVRRFVTSTDSFT